MHIQFCFDLDRTLWSAERKNKNDFILFHFFYLLWTIYFIILKQYSRIELLQSQFHWNSTSHATTKVHNNEQCIDNQNGNKNHYNNLAIKYSNFAHNNCFFIIIIFLSPSISWLVFLLWSDTIRYKTTILFIS